MSCSEYKLVAVSFTVGTEAGLALVAARSESDAFQILKNSGSRSGCANAYTLIQSRSIGMTMCCTYGLLMESYVNALEAYNAILHVANMLKGEKGDKGDPGATTNISDTFEDRSPDKALSARLGGILHDDIENCVTLGEVIEDNVSIRFLS